MRKRTRPPQPKRSAAAALHARALALMARVGYAAHGLVYLMIGGFALLAAVRSGARSVGSKGVLIALLSEPSGRVLLGALAAGLLCFALWRALQAFADADDRGGGARAIVQRTAYAGAAMFYLALAAWALAAIFGWMIGGRSEEKPIHDWTAWLLDFPFGRWLVAVIGAGVVATGLAICVKAFSGRIEERLMPEANGWAAVLGRLGFSPAPSCSC